jgi:hypothetical protein
VISRRRERVGPVEDSGMALLYVGMVSGE